MIYSLSVTLCFFSAPVQGGPGPQNEAVHPLNVPLPGPLLPIGRYLYSIINLLYLYEDFHCSFSSS